MKVKLERQDLNEVEEKHQDQKESCDRRKISELQHSNNRRQKALQKHLQTEKKPYETHENS